MLRRHSLDDELSGGFAPADVAGDERKSRHSLRHDDVLERRRGQRHPGERIDDVERERVVGDVDVEPRPGHPLRVPEDGDAPIGEHECPLAAAGRDVDLRIGFKRLLDHAAILSRLTRRESDAAMRKLDAGVFTERRTAAGQTAVHLEIHGLQRRHGPLLQRWNVGHHVDRRQPAETKLRAVRPGRNLLTEPKVNSLRSVSLRTAVHAAGSSAWPGFGSGHE